MPPLSSSRNPPLSSSPSPQEHLPTATDHHGARCRAIYEEIVADLRLLLTNSKKVRRKAVGYKCVFFYHLPELMLVLP
jgi:hypothetical protein